MIDPAFRRVAPEWICRIITTLQGWNFRRLSTRVLTAKRGEHVSIEVDRRRRPDRSGSVDSGCASDIRVDLGQASGEEIAPERAPLPAEEVGIEPTASLGAHRLRDVLHRLAAGRRRLPILALPVHARPG